MKKREKRNKERMQNIKKNEEHVKSLKISKVFGFTRKSGRFPGFAVVVTFLCEILDDFHDLFSECVFPKRKSTTHFGWSTLLLKKSDNFNWTIFF